jgi:class 3 adenylate cyclase/tetratricopeptide (TPR) repeat protein
MNCPACGRENPDGAKFCNQCAGPLPLPCLKCGTSNPVGSQFCNECAAPLTASSSALRPKTNEQIRSEIHVTPEQFDSSSLPEGERKTVTALFADIKGSMELMEDLDPEEARAIVDPALRVMIDAVRRYDGYIVQSTGDGIFGLFGAPVAHEDHPQRALYAALRMQEDLKLYSDRLRVEGKLPLQARVGVNTGEAVVRSIKTGEGHTEYTPIGHSTGLAARMQALAPIGSIAATERTQRLCEGYFAFESLGPTEVKGVTEPINVYEVTGLGPLRTRLERAAAREFTKFVGREREIEAIRHAAIMAKGGRGQLVAVMAEPGVGKSRLFYEFKANSQAGWMVLEAFSLSHGEATAYLPLIDLLHDYFGIEPRDEPRQRREKVAGKVTMLDRSLEEETLPHLFALLGIAESDEPLAGIDPQIRRRRTHDAIKRILLCDSLNQPLMLIFEDLHWIDQETQAFLNLLAEGMANARVLMLVSYRPEYSHPWGSKTYYTQLRLDPLGPESAGAMLSALVGDSREMVPLKRLVLEHTEGNPLFMEELIQALFDEGALVRNGTVKLTRPLSQLKIPLTVQGILTARIDRLPPKAKDLLQMLAVIGTEFPLPLVRQVVQLPPDQLDRLLSGLQAGEFVYEQPAAGDVEYTFKHALTHDVVYSSLLTERRKLLHGRTARAIEALYSERLEDHLTELAHHFDRSGNLPKAVEYLGRTGDRAAQQVAHAEAIVSFTRALELLRRLPDGAARDRQELDLQMALSWSLFVARGPIAPERESALVRAGELCEQLGDNAKLMSALLALAHFRTNRLDLEMGRELAERVVALAEQAKAPAILAGAHVALGVGLFSTGQFEEARERFECAAELLGVGPSRNLDAYLAQGAHYLLVAVLIVIGRPSTALRRFHDLLADARRRADPYSIAIALRGDGLHHLLLRDSRMMAELADEMLSIATEHQMPIYTIQATFFRGWAMAAAGRAEEGIAEMRRSMSDPKLADQVSTAQMRVALAETCGKSGHPQEGLEMVINGLVVAERTGVRVAEAELHRLKGELLMIKDPSNAAEVERCLRTAIDIGRRQGARLFELRATVSLARLLRDTNRCDEARTMLAHIYNWFTEGFDTADLKDAKTMLDELAG